LSNLDESGGADEDDVRDDDSRDGGGDAHARIAVRTGDAGRATAIEHPHQAAAGSQQDHQRQEGAEGRPEAVVGGVEPGVAEQLARLRHGAPVLTAARHHHHAVAEKQRTGNEDRGDEDQDGGRHAVARLQTATRTHLYTVQRANYSTLAFDGRDLIFHHGFKNLFTIVYSPKVFFLRFYKFSYYSNVFYSNVGKMAYTYYKTIN